MTDSINELILLILMWFTHIKINVKVTRMVFEIPEIKNLGSK